MKDTVISLYDYTGEAVRPWAIAGFKCICFDIQHSSVSPRTYRYYGGGSISYVSADLHDQDALSDIAREYSDVTAFGMAFPVCTDMAVSGAAHFAKKLEADPLYQHKAVSHAVWCSKVFDSLGCPYFIENPVSVLSTQWRKPDHSFNPFEYGGYIPDDEAEHPVWPEFIAAFDAYPKKTLLWTGGDFTMPDPMPVECPAGVSVQYSKLGDKSMKTKNIRSATPRGFAKAVFCANSVIGT
jgi:hypothetical protein